MSRLSEDGYERVPIKFASKSDGIDNYHTKWRSTKDPTNAFKGSRPSTEGSQQSPHIQASLKPVKASKVDNLMTLKQACPSEYQRAQGAFKDSMIHWILQFTLLIAFRCVLHRWESQEIRCWKLYWFTDSKVNKRHSVTSIVCIKHSLWSKQGKDRKAQAPNRIDCEHFKRLQKVHKR